MTLELALALLGGLALGVLVATLARIGLRGGNLRQALDYRLVCPRLETRVDCRIVQDIRTGQWKRVESCSVFEDPHEVLCEAECVRLMNQGRLLPEAWRSAGWAPSPKGSA
jgi:hypothetical protein